MMSQRNFVPACISSSVFLIDSGIFTASIPQICPRAAEEEKCQSDIILIHHNAMQWDQERRL